MRGMYLVCVCGGACDVVCLVLPPTFHALKPAQVQGGPGCDDDIHQTYYSSKLSPLLPTNQLSRLIILSILHHKIIH